MVMYFKVFGKLVLYAIIIFVIIEFLKIVSFDKLLKLTYLFFKPLFTGKSINDLFYKCVYALHDMAAILHITYEEINFIVFIFIYPLLLFVLLGYIIYLKIQINKTMSFT